MPYEPYSRRAARNRRYELRCRSVKYFFSGGSACVQYYTLVVFKRDPETGHWRRVRSIRLGRSPVISEQMIQFHQLRRDLLRTVSGLRIGELEVTS